VIDGLAPPDLEAAGLAESLRRYAGLAGPAHGIRVTFTAAELPRLGAQAEAALYRVGQEALHNALRHAGASRIDVSLQPASTDGSGAGVRLMVEDDGKGFDPEAAGRGLGLVSMRERADSVGGRLTVSTQVGHGTVIELEVPGGRS
jgi:signal transduction histidine kinase